MTRDTIIRKIKALFRLGDRRRNQSEAEALAAIDAARRLMARYQISEADVDASKDGETQRTAWTFSEGVGISSGREPMEWEINLGQAIELLTCTRLLRARSSVPRVRRIALVFCGDIGDVEIAVALFKILLAQIRRSAIALYAPPADLFQGKRPRRGKWGLKHSSYAVGFAIAVHRRAKEPLTGISPAEANSFAIVVSNKKQWLEKTFENVYPGLPTREPCDQQKLDDDALMRGYIDGARADIGLKRHLADAGANL